jgi:tRNA(adenine34) deaminase
MREAIELAREGIRTRNGEVGCVVTRGDVVVYRGYNTMNSTWDVTGHAEISALRALSTELRTFDLAGHTLYCTLQPCGMCACACVWARLDRVVFGAGSGDVPAEYFDLIDLGPAEIFARSTSGAPELTAGVLRDDCAALYWDPHRARL